MRSGFDYGRTDAGGVSQGHEERARIVKETISALDGRRSFADERAMKPREEIGRELAESGGASVTRASFARRGFVSS
jgi:hypothetical protein